MITHPEVQAKAQAELDSVVGRGRLPSFADQPDLVYCGAVVREILRWRTVIAGGLAHATTEDDWYNGALRATFPTLGCCAFRARRSRSCRRRPSPAQVTSFRKGRSCSQTTGPSTSTRCVPRASPFPLLPRADHLPLVQELYPDPTSFKPERFISSEGNLIGTKFSDAGHHAYGFGRRICPGKHIADVRLSLPSVPLKVVA